MDKEHYWVVAYDSPSNKRRTKIAKLLEGYGQRVQWSVFECRLRRDEVQGLLVRLRRLIHAEEDSLRLWPVPDRSWGQLIRLGRAVSAVEWSDKLI
ncbi:CRISPR-associated endonuclease Cas2 [Vulcanococcus limneticus]|uniref:CRISPR-associated endonuclease Cas2 n=1 Tax=Vulcanococcus limneticus TaxID=2170428 RepID=UPI00398BF60F